MDSSNSKLIFIVIVLFVIGLGLGIFAGYSSGRAKGLSEGIIKGKADADTAWRSKIDAKYPRAPEPEEVFSYTGKITSIEGNKFVLTVTVPAPNPFEDDKVITKTVAVDENTKIIRRDPKDPATYEKEKSAALRNKLPIPDPSTVKILSFGDLKTEMPISVASKNNIKNTAEFTADTVLLY